jgi:putative addiction module component (TIGR02574 family)
MADEETIESDDSFVISDDQWAELERRLADYKLNPDGGLTWEELRARIVSKS